jgi:hypothetical protein
MSEVVLHYGRRTTRDFRRDLRRALCALGLCALCLLIVFGAYLIWYYHDYYGVHSALVDAAPKAKIKIGGDDETGFGPYEVYETYLDLDGSGKRIIGLNGPQGSHLRDGTHLVLSQVGPNCFAVITPEHYWLQYIDIGSDGDFADLLPIKFKDMNDLVSRYDQLLSTVRQLPRNSQITTKDGKTCELRILNAP